MKLSALIAVMKDGDYINVTVVALNQTVGSRLLSMVTGSQIDERVYCTAGGMVGNTKR